METVETPQDRRSPATAAPILVVFVDGVGLGPVVDGNPFAGRPLPGFRRLAGGPLVAGLSRVEPEHVVLEIDANLGVEGLPQSGTGQTTLFTGVNAARALGRHVPALPGPRLKAIIESEGLFAKAKGAGSSVAFANAFAPSYLRGLETGERRASVTVHLARSAGVALRSEDELLRNQAVAWDLERDIYRRAAGDRVPAVAAATAGGHLAALAPAHDLTLYETFLTDLAGHGRIPIHVLDAIERVDAFLAGLLAALPPRVTLVVCSDHGNVEEPGHARHTRNPVPLVALGPLARRFAELRSIEDLTPALLAALASRQSDELPRSRGATRSATAAVAVAGDAGDAFLRSRWVATRPVLGGASS